MRAHPSPGLGRAAARGFTLTELMAVVVITGILAAAGTAMFRQHILESRTLETTAMIRSIGAAQERFRAEAMRYLDVSQGDLTSYYPSAEVGEIKRAWDVTAHTDLERWQLLGPTVPGPVQFGYACTAYDPGIVALPAGLQADPGWPAGGNFLMPFYVVQAVGDVSGSGNRVYYVGASFASHIVVAEEHAEGSE